MTGCQKSKKTLITAGCSNKLRCTQIR